MPRDLGSTAPPLPSGSAARTGVTLFIDPFTRHFLEDRLFDTAIASDSSDEILGPWVHRRLTGRSSGDNVEVRRPTLGPL